MRKNGSRLISLRQYKFTDLFLFALILLGSELLIRFAVKWFPNEALYTFSLMVPIVLTVMMRWGWVSVIYSVISGLLVCVLNYKTAAGIHYATYIIGNAFIAVMLIFARVVGKDKIRSKWWSSALFAAGGWLCVYVGRAVVWMIGYAVSPVEGATLWSGFINYAIGDILSLFMSVLVVIVLRRLDGMFEDQVSYLKRLDKERRDKMRVDAFGENLEEIDEETLSIFKRDNDLYK